MGYLKKQNFKLLVFLEFQMEEIQDEIWRTRSSCFYRIWYEYALGVKGLVVLNDTKKIVSMRNLSVIQEQRLEQKDNMITF